MNEEQITQILDGACKDENLYLQVVLDAPYIQVFLNRQGDYTPDYNFLVETICYTLAHLQVPNILYLAIYSRVYGEYEPDWETAVEIYPQGEAGLTQARPADSDEEPTGSLDLEPATTIVYSQSEPDSEDTVEVDLEPSTTILGAPSGASFSSTFSRATPAASDDESADAEPVRPSPAPRRSPSPSPLSLEDIAATFSDEMDTAALRREVALPESGDLRPQAPPPSARRQPPSSTPSPDEEPDTGLLGSLTDGDLALDSPPASEPPTGELVTGQLAEADLDAEDTDMQVPIAASAEDNTRTREAIAAAPQPAISLSKEGDPSAIDLSEYCFIRNKKLVYVKVNPPSGVVARFIQAFHELPNASKASVLPQLSDLLEDPDTEASDETPEDALTWLESLRALEGEDFRKSAIWLSRYCARPEETLAELAGKLSAAPAAQTESKDARQSSSTAASVREAIAEAASPNRPIVRSGGETKSGEWKGSSSSGTGRRTSGTRTSTGMPLAVLATLGVAGTIMGLLARGISAGGGSWAMYLSLALGAGGAIALSLKRPGLFSSTLGMLLLGDQFLRGGSRLLGGGDSAVSGWLLGYVSGLLLVGGALWLLHARSTELDLKKFGLVGSIAIAGFTSGVVLGSLGGGGAICGNQPSLLEVEKRVTYEYCQLSDRLVPGGLAIASQDAVSLPEEPATLRQLNETCQKRARTLAEIPSPGEDWDEAGSAIEVATGVYAFDWSVTGDNWQTQQRFICAIVNRPGASPVVLGADRLPLGWPFEEYQAED